MLAAMAIRKAVLLAAGRGTRLGALTASTPKPLLVVAGRPLIAWIAGGLMAAGIRDIAVVTGYMAQQMERWCRGFEAANPGLKITAIRQAELNGTAGAMLAAREWLGGVESFIFGWGDILMDPQNYPRFCKAAEVENHDLLMAVNEMEDPWRGAAVYVDSEKMVTRLVEKPPRGSSTTRWNNSGLFASSSILFRYLERVGRSARGELELPQAIAAMIGAGCAVRAFAVSGFWSDVGTPEDLEAARRQFAQS